MEEVQVIDCPPTPEILLASNTPPSTSLLDLLDSSSSAEELDNCSASGLGGTEGTTESGRNSPPPKCAICLGKCRQKCYTNSCRHQFCYRCLLEWSKIKAECPLCKQVFRSIIYNHKSIDRYQEHIIPASPPNASNRDGQGVGSIGVGAARAAPQVYHRLDFTLSQPPRFTYSATLRVQPSQSERLQQLFLHQSGDVQRFSREFPDDSIPSRQNGPEWRRYIYHRRLHARPLPDINGRLRECSSAFYRENPAQIHRLMPWINRELIALCRANPEQVTLIIEDFPNLLMTNDITSPVFRERVSYWGRARTVHFIHELLNFARSPYDMIGYDRCVQYDPYHNSVVVLSSSSSSSSGSGLSGSEGEDDVVRIVEPVPGPSGSLDSVGGTASARRRGRTQFTIETRSSDQTVIMTGSFGGAGVSGIVSVSTSGTQTNNAGGSSSSSSSFPDLSRMHALTSLAPQALSRLEDGTNISLSSSDSDDCRIVGALKPPHLRTPEMVSLESESDSDVMIVNEDDNRREDAAQDENVVLEHLFPETCLIPATITKLEDRSGASASEYNNGASTSSGSASGGMKKYYARPRLNRYSEGIGFKSIYEASESEKSKEASLPSDSDPSSHDEVKFNIRTQAPMSIRKRKATKRRPATPSASSVESSKHSSTSDTDSSPSSTSTTSLSSSSSGSSDSDSDSDFQSDEQPTKIILKKRSRRSKVQTSRKSSKRRRKETKKRPKVKKRKSSSTKRNRKRQQLQTPKVPKSSSESGKGTTASCTSVPSAEVLPSASNASPKSATSSCKKRKLRSIVVKPNVLKLSRQASSKRRRKAPICSELITSTDFSSDENQKEPDPPAAAVQPVEAQQPQESSTSASSSGDDTSDSENQLTIASLIRAVQRSAEESEEQSEKQNTSTASTSSNSTSAGTSCSSSSHTDASSPMRMAMQSQQQNRHHHRQADQDQEDQLPEEDVSVAQAIAVGAEVEL